jgi:uncharacterized protein YjbI with pentapeptide repeats
MLFWIIKIIIFSIIFIFLIHNVINFLLETLTISKTKDMIQITNNNYKNIYEVLSREYKENLSQKNLSNENLSQKNLSNENLSNENLSNENITMIDSLPNTILFNENDDMKNELTNYLREQLNNS